MPNSKLRFAALAIFLAGCGATTVTNNPAVVLKSVLVSPKSVTLLAGGTSQLSALGIYSDGSTQDLSATATWTSSGPAVTVSASGLATAVTAGSATITATQGGFSSTSSVTVTAAGVIGLSIFAPTLRLPAGHSEVLSAIAISSDGSTTSTSPTWSITQGSDKGQISASGQLTGTAAGIVRVQAQQGSLTSTRDITIDDATASALTVTPSTLTLAAGQSRTLSAFATFSDGASLDVSADAAFSSDSGLIELDGAQVLAISAGTAAITVSYEGKSATSTLTITAVPPARVVVGGPSAMFTTHAAQFTASAIYPGGDALDVTSDATWTVTPSGTAATGTVSVSTAGTSTVSATFQGLIGLATVQVRAPAPQSLSIASVGQALSVGRSAVLAATLTLTDSSVQDVTGTVTWTSDNADITVAAGVVTAHQSGPVTITATLASASLSATFAI
ncbi:MAG: Ig-like domain-containing protein, partial [Deltaproteobacteria bacterium]|nr:Ig-like domain-containing protein [Deltaproteobacteria bacterium]